jgi:hypothetical protein
MYFSDDDDCHMITFPLAQRTAQIFLRQYIIKGLPGKYLFMAQTKIPLSNIGIKAWRLLDQNQPASVWSITSTGVFLLLPSGWLLFLSNQTFRGPLTLNLPEGTTPMILMQSGSPVEIHDGEISFLDLDLVLSTQESQVWTAPQRPAASPTVLELRRERLAELCSTVQAERSQNMPFEHFSKALENVERGISLADTLENLLGYGPGLTPVGDDFIIGFLVAARRWGDQLSTEDDPDLPLLCQTLQQAAYRKTTLLSANLIECASDGLADERLVLAIDGIMTGKPDPQTCAAHLLSWGNSSGLGALLGMALAVKLTDYQRSSDET